MLACWCGSHFKTLTHLTDLAMLVRIIVQKFMYGELISNVSLIAY